MAGKISEMTSAAPALTDWIEFTDDPGGTPLTRRTTFTDAVALATPVVYVAAWNMLRTTTITNTRYSGCNGYGSLDSTEGSVDHTTIDDWTFIQLKLSVHTNSQDGTVTVGLRDDAATVTGSTIAVTTTSTGEFSTSITSVAIASGSAVTFINDHSPSTSGTFGYNSLYAKVEIG
jgi:hypothetical protein